MIILIDGNNLIHKSDSLKKLFQSDKEASMLSLIETVISRISRTDKAVMVFDGFGNFKKPNVHFSGKDTADNLIRKEIEKFPDHKKLKVVSSDNEITGFAKVCGCAVQRSEDFWKSLNASGKPSKEDNINQLYLYDKKEKPDRSSKKAFDFFKKQFT